MKLSKTQARKLHTLFRRAAELQTELAAGEQPELADIARGYTLAADEVLTALDIAQDRAAPIDRFTAAANQMSEIAWTY